MRTSDSPARFSPGRPFFTLGKRAHRFMTFTSLFTLTITLGASTVYLFAADAISGAPAPSGASVVMEINGKPISADQFERQQASLSSTLGS